METTQFDYELPEEAIAQEPVEPRDAARLLVDRGPDHGIEDRAVKELPAFLRPGDVLVVNTTRVLPARLHLRKPTGGAVEVLLLERIGGTGWEALVRPSRRVAAGTRLTAGPDLEVEVGGPRGDGARRVDLYVPPEQDDVETLARYGIVPLPPYITRPLDDPERYQTVYADAPESVAAPTAGLHLTADLLEACRAVGSRVVPVELAVGLGTFRPMTATRVEDHTMHAERYRVPAGTLTACQEARRTGGRVVAVGTTVVRALEAAAADGDLDGRTELFIRRPFDWQLVDVLMTNFHLPRSSLLVLVDAFVGPRWRRLYEHALAAGYRFLSFGDAMLVERAGRTDRGSPAEHLGHPVGPSDRSDTP